MTEPTSSLRRIWLTKKWSHEEEEKLRQVMHKIADDLTERAQLLRSFCSETDTRLVYNAVLFCDVNNCPYRKRFKEVLTHTIEELEKTKRSFKSKQLEALRKRLCKELARI